MIIFSSGYIRTFSFYLTQVICWNRLSNSRFVTKQEETVLYGIYKWADIKTWFVLVFLPGCKKNMQVFMFGFSPANFDQKSILALTPPHIILFSLLVF